MAGTCEQAEARVSGASAVTARLMGEAVAASRRLRRGRAAQRPLVRVFVGVSCLGLHAFEHCFGDLGRRVENLTAPQNIKAMRFVEGQRSAHFRV